MLEINDLNFEREVLKSDQPVVVDFWASWCTPCRMMLPVVEEFSREFSARLKVVRLDVDTNPNIAERFAIRSIPSLLFFKEGKLLDQIIGTCTKRELIEQIEKFLS